MPVREPIGTIAYEVTHMLGDAMRRFEIQILPGENAPGRSGSCNPCPFSAGDGDIQIKIRELRQRRYFSHQLLSFALHQLEGVISARHIPNQVLIGGRVGR